MLSPVLVSTVDRRNVSIRSVPNAIGSRVVGCDLVVITPETIALGAIGIDTLAADVWPVLPEIPLKWHSISGTTVVHGRDRRESEAHAAAAIPMGGDSRDTMHGIIFKGLKDFVVDTYDRETWDAVREEADVPRTLYVPVSTYPDEHLMELVDAAVELSGEDAPDLLQAFGRHVVPSLVRTYGIHVDENWTGLDLIENVEEYIHEALRSKQISEFRPPAIEAQRVDEASVVVRYDSDRQLCDVTMGLIQGVGKYYGEPLDVEELVCMHDGAPKCELVVTNARARFGEITSRRARADGGVGFHDR